MRVCAQRCREQKKPAKMRKEEAWKAWKAWKARDLALDHARHERKSQKKFSRPFVNRGQAREAAINFEIIFALCCVFVIALWRLENTEFVLLPIFWLLFALL